jgi:phosphohistidine phosphatase
MVVGVPGANNGHGWEEGLVKLCLVQHGEAKPKDVDPDRHLIDTGERDARKVAAHLASCAVTVGRVWHSGKARAQQTAEILAEALGGAVTQRDGLAPKNDVGPIAEEFAAAREDLMVVGHLPFLGKLASLLVAGDEDAGVVAFQYAGVVCLERADHDWAVRWMLVPDLVT